VTAIQAAQAAVVDGVTIFAGANTDSIPHGQRLGPAGGVALDDTGMATNAGLWQYALHAYGAPF